MQGVLADIHAVKNFLVDFLDSFVSPLTEKQRQKDNLLSADGGVRGDGEVPNHPTARKLSPL